MSIRQTLAINTITSITTQWIKMAERLNKAMDVLREIISNNKASIYRIESKAKEQVVSLEDKNKELLETIGKTEAFKDNLEKMFVR